MSCIAMDYAAPKQEQFNVCPKMFDTYHGGITYLTQTGCHKRYCVKKLGASKRKVSIGSERNPAFSLGNEKHPDSGWIRSHPKKWVIF